MIQLRVFPDSRLQGVTIDELRLPANVVVALVIRGNESFSPAGGQRIRAGDELLIVTPAGIRDQIESRIHGVDKRGRLASWLPHRRGDDD